MTVAMAGQCAGELRHTSRAMVVRALCAWRREAGPLGVEPMGLAIAPCKTQGAQARQ
jgi:hypothetical protein